MCASLHRPAFGGRPLISGESAQDPRRHIQPEVGPRRDASLIVKDRTHPTRVSQVTVGVVRFEPAQIDGDVDRQVVPALGEGLDGIATPDTVSLTLRFAPQNVPSGCLYAPQNVPPDLLDAGEPSTSCGQLAARPPLGPDRRLQLDPET
jgi:hypothetical protein